MLLYFSVTCSVHTNFGTKRNTSPKTLFWYWYRQLIKCQCLCNCQQEMVHIPQIINTLSWSVHNKEFNEFAPKRGDFVSVYCPY